MKHILSLFALFFLSCGYFQSHKERDASEPYAASIGALRALFAERKAELEAASDKETGWPEARGCDGTLWAGLSCAAGAPVKIELAEYEAGQIHRRPSPSCWTKDEGDLGARSTVSNDMLTGYLWCLWRRENVPALERLAQYGQDHNWVMGEPFPEMSSRVVMRGNGQALLGSMLYTLSRGADDRTYRHLPQVYLPVLEDFEEHLQVLGILLSSEVERRSPLLEVNGQMRSRIAELAAARPGDALFQAAEGVFTGDYSKAAELLLSKDYVFPPYVRGEAVYEKVHWLFAAHIVLKHNGGL